MTPSEAEERDRIANALGILDAILTFWAEDERLGTERRVAAAKAMSDKYRQRRMYLPASTAAWLNRRAS